MYSSSAGQHTVLYCTILYCTLLSAFEGQEKSYSLPQPSHSPTNTINKNQSMYTTENDQIQRIFSSSCGNNSSSQNQSPHNVLIHTNTSLGVCVKSINS